MIIQQKTRADEAWKLQRQTERENTVALRDAAVTEITSKPEAYAKYLDLQGANPQYSAGNIGLALYQLDNATLLGTKERWNALGRTILPTEVGRGAKIFVRTNPAQRRGYSIGDAYDVSQTQGRPARQLHLLPDTPQMERALAALLNFAPCPVLVDPQQSGAAWYDPKRMELLVNPNADDGTAFAAIAAEIAQARFHAKGLNGLYDRTISTLDAESISYLICRRVGLSRPLPDLSFISAYYDGFDTEQRGAALSHIQEMAKKIGNSVERSITPQQRTQGHPGRPVR